MNTSFGFDANDVAAMGNLMKKINEECVCREDLEMVNVALEKMYVVWKRFVRMGAQKSGAACVLDVMHRESDIPLKIKMGQVPTKIKAYLSKEDAKKRAKSLKRLWKN